MKREPQGLIPQKKLCQDGQIVKYVVFLSLLRVKLEWKSFVFLKVIQHLLTLSNEALYVCCHIYHLINPKTKILEYLNKQIHWVKGGTKHQAKAAT